MLLALWTGEPVNHHGAHLTVDDVRFRPRPVQQPRIPVWGAALWPRRPGLRRAATLDGVMPFDPRLKGFDGADVARILDVVTEERQARGVAADAPFDVVIAGHLPDMPLDELERAGATWALESFMPMASLAVAGETVAAGPPR